MVGCVIEWRKTVYNQGFSARRSCIACEGDYTSIGDGCSESAQYQSSGDNRPSSNPCLAHRAYQYRERIGMKNQIKEIREYLFQLCKDADDMDTIHWYVAIDDCFENDDFQIDQAENLRWRLQALSWKGTSIGRLSKMIEPVLEDAGILKDGKWLSQGEDNEENNI